MFKASIHDFASFERFIYEHLNNMLDFVLRAVHRATKQLTLFSSHSLEPLKCILHIDFSHVKNYLWLPPLLIIVDRFHLPPLFSYYFLHLGHSFSRVSPPLKTIPTMWTAYRLWNVTMTAITIQQHAHVMLRYALDKFILNIYIGTMHKIWAKNTTRTFAL